MGGEPGIRCASWRVDGHVLGASSPVHRTASPFEHCWEQCCLASPCLPFAQAAAAKTGGKWKLPYSFTRSHTKPLHALSARRAHDRMQHGHRPTCRQDPERALRCPESDCSKAGAHLVVTIQLTCARHTVSRPTAGSGRRWR